MPFAAQSASSFTAKATTPIDPLEREAREIERRRSRNAERRDRILNTKTRLLGVDTAALSEQIAVKQAAAAAEVERSQSFDLASNHYARLTQEQIATREAHNRLRREQTAIAQQQQAQEKRIADAALRAQKTNAVVDNDSTVFLNFSGEDTTFAQRARAQRRQQADWITQHLQSSERVQEAEAKEEHDYAQHQQEMIKIQEQLSALKQEAEIKEKQRISLYNRSLAQEKKLKESLYTEKNKLLNEMDILHHTQSHLLTENNINDGNNGFTFKGFTVNERQRILDEQNRQIQEKQARAQLEAADQVKWANMSEAHRREQIRLHAERQRQEQLQRVLVRDQRLLQARQKQITDAYLNTEVYTNPVQEEYFEQFGTSCR